MAAKYKYDAGGAELVIKDLKAVPGTYQEGQVLVGAAAEGGGVRSAAAGIAASIIGVCNQGETLPISNALNVHSNNGATLSGTQALGTLENLKVIINAEAVYAIEYSQATPLAWGAVGDTAIAFLSAGAGFASLGGGWLWSYNTGELDYVVSSSVGAGSTTAVTVTGTGVTSTSGIVLQPCYQLIPLELTADALNIAANADDVGVAGSNAVNGVIIENRIESALYGSEILDCRVHNQKVRFMNTNAAQKDKTKAFAYVKFAHLLS